MTFGLFPKPHYLLIPALLLFGLSTALGQTPAPAPAPAPFHPLIASLSMPLDISIRAKPGTRFQATVLQPWRSATCYLRIGAAIQGHISQVDRHTKTTRRSDMHLVFDTAQCDGHHSTPLKMTLIGLLGPDTPSPGGESGVGKDPDLTDVPNSIGGGLRSVSNAVDAHTYALAGRAVPTDWKPGMVFDVPSTTLAMDKDGASVVERADKDVRLEAKTYLILEVAPQ